MKNWFSTVAGLAALLLAGMAQAQVVKDVQARQRYPWNNLVDIDYTIEGAQDTPRLAVRVKATDRDSGKSVDAKSFTGTVPVANGRHRITWDAGKDQADLFSTNVVYGLTLVQLPPPLYLVIDLSSGANSSRYPVSGLSAVPSGGWTDEYKTTKLVLRKIPAGTFIMGSPEGELGRFSNEVQHQVTLTQDFYVGVFEVTQKQWNLVMGSNPSDYGGSTRPVECVSYNMIRGSSAGSGWPRDAAVDAGSFIGRLRARTGIAEFDLPTEAQWEYACRAGTTTALNNGKNLTTTDGRCPNLDEVGRYWDNGGSNNKHVAVGSYAPNAWGLYDMHGNVWEWCLDWYGGYGGQGTDPKGADSGSNRVLRSGSWGYIARSCRSAVRHYSYPSYGYDGDGFRLTRILPAR